jgi:hypothetical protein
LGLATQYTGGSLEDFHSLSHGRADHNLPDHNTDHHRNHVPHLLHLQEVFCCQPHKPSVTAQKRGWGLASRGGPNESPPELTWRKGRTSLKQECLWSKREAFTEGYSGKVRTQNSMKIIFWNDDVKGKTMALGMENGIRMAWLWFVRTMARLYGNKKPVWY